MITESLKNQILDLIMRISPKTPIFLKVIFLLFALFFLLVIIYFLKKTTWLRRIFFQDFMEFITSSSYKVGRITKAWEKIIKRLERNTEDEAKLAILEADDILNEILNRMGYKKEETLEEKLDEITPDIISNLEDLYDAHKVHNNIVHDPDYRLSLTEAQRIIFIYEKSLHDLEAL